MHRSDIVFSDRVDKKLSGGISAKIIHLAPKDFKNIYDLYVKYRESANVKSSINDVKNFLAEQAQRTDDRIYAVKIGDKYVGILHYGKEFSTLSNSYRIKIKAMFVEAGYRGNGLAKKMVGQLKQDFSNKEIVVKARRSNEHSPFLYRTCGFEEDKEYCHFVMKRNF